MIVREIVERPSGSANPPLPPPFPKLPSSGGFPVAKRREPVKRATSNTISSKHVDANVFTSSTSVTDNRPREGRSEIEEMKQAIEEENIARVNAMSLQEREQEAEELKERFGSGVVDLMRKRKDSRRRIAVREVEAGPSRIAEPAQITKNEVEQLRREVESENRQKVSCMGGLQVAEEVQELEERFGSDVLAALRRRAQLRTKSIDETPASPAVVGDTASPIQSILLDIPPPPPLTPDDTSPEALKERYFPNHPSEPSKLAWLRPSASTSSDNSIRFDLSGRVLSESDRDSIPTTAGLHHHGTSPDLAGYTLQDVLWLCRSTVPSQRITMLGVLARIVESYHSGESTQEVTHLCQEECVQAKATSLGLEILVNPTRNLGITRAGIEVLYQALGGRKWTWLDSETRYRPDEDNEDFATIPFEDVMPRFQELLSRNSALPPISIYQLTQILRRAVYHSQKFAEIVIQIVPTLIRDRVIRPPWPLDEREIPSVVTLRLLGETLDSSRSCATMLVKSDILDPLLKFLVVSTWADSDQQKTLEIVSEVLKTFTSLARYGLGVSTATKAVDIFRSISSWTKEQSETPARIPVVREVVKCFFDLLTAWTTCAIDPHKTTPEHALTWVQVTALGWHEEALDVLARLVRQAGCWSETAAVLRILVAWVTGTEINSPHRGLEEKKVTIVALRDLGLGKIIKSDLDAKSNAEDGMIEALVPVVRLELLLFSAVEAEEVILDGSARESLVGKFGMAYSNLDLTATSLRYEVMRLGRKTGSLRDHHWCQIAFELLSAFQPGQEDLSLDLMDELIKFDWTSIYPDSQDALGEIEHVDGLQILRPLLQYTVLPSAASVVAPIAPSHIYLKATTSARRPATLPLETKREGGLPLASDWAFTPLDELLQSSTSPALAQAPPDWNASELEIVRATLAFAEIITRTRSISRSLLLLNLMKVFMLEHDQSSSSAEPEAFRDTSIVKSLQQLIKPLLSPCPDPIELETMETIAIPFLGPDIPFFQFYADFVNLYEAISYSDTIFSQLILPPLAMNYPVDFRKQLWVEQPTSLRSIRTSTKDVPLESSLRAYFLPREVDADVLAGYTRALVRGWVGPRTEFLYRIACSHLAHLFWHDEQDQEADEDGNEETKQDREKEKPVRLNLMKAMIASAAPAVIKEIISLDLEAPGEGAHVTSEAVLQRMTVIERTLGPQARRKADSVAAL